ncbi:hypothetical protein B0H19DRAFT_1267449 [Mycena capillaripes]|nr:hypothetical protein B0H19DRAFT_1267449 [Mycena capillaripes]
MYSSDESTKLHFPHDPSNDVVAEITVPTGTCSLKFARFPASPGTNEPSTACLLWAETKTALLAKNFQPSPLSPPSRPDMYATGPSAVAGTGVFATEDIGCGESIIVERPFLMAVSQPPEHVTDLATVGPMVFAIMDVFVVERLSPVEQIQMLRLFSADDSTYMIMSQNSIPIFDPLPGEYEGPHSVVCRDISRINHSCTPNVELTWDAASLSFTLHSNRRISKGEELFRSYENLFAPRSERVERFVTQYDFHCTCPSCSLPDEESKKSDQIRRFIVDDLEKFTGGSGDDPEFSAWLSDPSLPDDYIIARYENIIELMNTDGCGLLPLRVLYLSQLMRTYVALGDAERARYWASKLMDMDSSHPVSAAGRESASPILAGRGPAEDEEWGIRKKST